MKIWHKKRVLTWPSELREKLLALNLYEFNFTAEGRRIQ